METNLKAVYVTVDLWPQLETETETKRNRMKEMKRERHSEKRRDRHLWRQLDVFPLWIPLTLLSGVK